LPRLAYLCNTIFYMSISAPHKKRGRPATGRDPIHSIRFPPRITAAIQAAAEADADHPNRSEMIRRIVKDWLIAHGHLDAGS
jgi:hypothetical protein